MNFGNKFFILFILTLLSLNYAIANEDEVRDKAKLLYLAQKYSDAIVKINEIPDDKKNGFDWFLIGNSIGNKDEAISFYIKSLTADKKFYQSYYNLAKIYEAKKQYDDAIKYYKLAIKAKKDFSFAYYNLGCCYLELKKYKQARTAFAKAIVHNQYGTEAYYNLAYTYLQLGDKKRAEGSIKIYNDLMQKRN